MPAIPDFDLSKATTPVAPAKPSVLEASSLDELDLDNELVTHYNRASRMVEALEFESDIPANQKAQAMNTLTTILQQIIKIRTDLYNAEYLKKIEQILLKTLKALPVDVQQEFMEEYEQSLRSAS